MGQAEIYGFLEKQDPEKWFTIAELVSALSSSPVAVGKSIMILEKHKEVEVILGGTSTYTGGIRRKYFRLSKRMREQ